MRNTWITLALALIFAAPVTAAPVFRVRVEVSADNDAMKSRITSALSRELRKLGDVTVAADNADLALHIAATSITNKGGRDTGYALALAVTWAKLPAPWEGWVSTFVLISSDLDEVCKNGAAVVDTQVLDGIRNASEKQTEGGR